MFEIQAQLIDFVNNITVFSSKVNQKETPEPRIRID